MVVLPPAAANGLLSLLLACAWPAAAAAQISGRLAVDSDFRLRASTLSAGSPVASAMLNADLPEGVYASIAGTVGSYDGEARFLGWQANTGIARPLGHGFTVDAGIQRLQYRPAYAGGRDYRYTEIYLGLDRKPVTARVYYSPDYLSLGLSTLYVETEATLSPARILLVNAHFGALFYLDSAVTAPTRTDWRLGVTRSLGAFELHAAVSGGGPGKQRYLDQDHSRTAVTVGGAWNF